MHRRAIISDIHGNLPALEAVLADIQTQNVDDIVCLGDVCGYGPQPIECIKLIRQKSAWCLLGNHDEAIYKEPIAFSRNAYEAVVWQRTLLDPAVAFVNDAHRHAETQERWDWLQSLSPSRSERNVRYVHASPRDPIHEYVLKEDFDVDSGGPTRMGCGIMASVDWLCFCGHSHRPGVVAEDYHWWLPAELTEHMSLIRPGFKTIVNVGSVGQPRDGVADSCYVIFEFDPPKDTPSRPTQLLNAVHNSNATVIISKSNATTRVALAPSTPIQLPDIATSPTPLPFSAVSATALAVGNDDETRGEEDQGLQRARDTVVMLTPKVFFRRVKYDIKDAQSRFFAIPELPRYNGLRLALGK